jgi:hypothetical protein
MFISKLGPKTLMKLVQAMPGMPSPVTEGEVERFLESKLNIQLATYMNV